MKFILIFASALAFLAIASCAVVDKASSTVTGVIGTGTNAVQGAGTVISGK